MADAIRIQVGEAEAGIDDVARRILITELWADQRPGGAADAAAAALERAPGAPAAFDVPQLDAVQRGLSNLEGAGRLRDHPDLRNLLELVNAVVAPSPVEYELHYKEGNRRSERWTSRSGEFFVGDRLSTAGGDFRVANVDGDRLTLEPYDPADAVLPPELSGN
jgi:hypothetical protein